jgi:DNA-binding MarR family transcriptional regulator
MRQHALSGPQIGILLYLGEHDGAVQEDLVRDIFLDKGTIGRHLQNLERRGYVRREVARDDKRYQHVFLTPSSEGAATAVRGFAPTLEQAGDAQFKCQ